MTLGDQEKISYELETVPHWAMDARIEVSNGDAEGKDTLENNKDEDNDWTQVLPDERRSCDVSTNLLLPIGLAVTAGTVVFVMVLLRKKVPHVRFVSTLVL